MGERHHAAVASPAGGIEIVGVDHPRADRPEQPDVVLPRFLDTLEAKVHHDVGADLAVQGDHGGDILEVEDVDGLAADLAEHDIACGDLADGRHHPAFPAVDDLGRLGLVVKPVRARPGLAPAAEAAAATDVDVQQHGRTSEAQCGQREPERDH